MGAIKGVGEGPIEAIVNARKQGGSFRDLFDFCQRIDTKKVNKRCLEALIRSGAFDKIGPCPKRRELNRNRAILDVCMEEAVKAAEQSARSAASGLDDLFGGPAPAANENPYEKYGAAREWPDKERLRGEKETLGLYLTGHPIDEYEKEVRHFVRSRISDLQAGRDSVNIAGLIVNMRVMKNKRGDKMGFLTLDDRSGRIEVSLFAEAFQRYQSLLLKDTLVVVEGEVSVDDYSGSNAGVLKANARRVLSLVEARSQYAGGLEIGMESADCQRPFVDELQNLFRSHQGDLPVTIHFEKSDAKGLIHLGEEWKILPSDELMQLLQERYGKGRIRLQYK